MPTISFIGSASGASASIGPYNLASGHCLVVAAYTYQTPTALPGDTAGNNFLQAVKSSGSDTFIWYVKNTVANVANFITFSPITSTYSAVFAWDISGVDTSNPLDATGAGIGTGTTSATSAITTQFANEAIIVINGITSGYSTSSLPVVGGNSMTLDGNTGGGGNEGAGAHLVVSTIQTGVTAGMTLGSASWAALVATFKAPTYSISGTILDSSSNPIIGVTVACTGQTNTTTASDGTYSFTGVSGSVTVTPTLTEWTFSPISLGISSATSTANFTGTETFYSISGNAGVGGATVFWTASGIFQTELGGWFLLEGGGFLELEGTSGSVTADGSGNYIIPNLINDNYQIIPSKTGYTFSPTSASEIISGSSIIGVNFIATQGASVYSQPDCRNFSIFPNSTVNIQNTLFYTKQTSSNSAVPGTDSRAAGAPVDCRVSPNIPQNSRTPGTYGPGE